MANASTENFRDSLTTVDSKGKRVWIHPKKPKGPLHNWRVVASIVQLAILFGIPFLKVNGEPFVLLNIFERKFILFGVKFWPQDFYLIVLVFITSVFFIVLFTVVYGRIFCGWICPQTIFMEMVFRKVEYLFEGDYMKQRKLDKMPWNREKLLRRGTKHVFFFGISVLVANTVIAYMVGVDELWTIVNSPVSENKTGFIAMLGFSILFYWIFAWFREQVCTIACPYGRLQGVMLDKNSVVVAYDHKRGEPRGKLRKGQERTEGDCIDCYQCVHVCPTGIDIRNGTQMECVNCTACIDVCNDIMTKVDKPKGLIRYASENNIESGTKFRFTPRIASYTILIVVLMGLTGGLMLMRSDVDATLTKASGALFNRTDDNRIRNIYDLKVLNKTIEHKPLDIKLLSHPTGRVTVVGEKDIEVDKGAAVKATILLEIPLSDLKERVTDIKIGVYSNGKLLTTEKARFLGPPITNR